MAEVAVGRASREDQVVVAHAHRLAIGGGDENDLLVLFSTPTTSPITTVVLRCCARTARMARRSATAITRRSRPDRGAAGTGGG